MTRLEKAFELFDAYNYKSLEQLVWEGKEYPSEYFYALKLYDWVKKLEPDASEALLLASRCQHIGRWEIARNTYPEGRIGYLTWRSDLSKFHAQTAASILSGLDYDSETIDRVGQIQQKKRLKLDAEVQTIENALCLVFLQFQYDDLVSKLSEEKMITVLQKTWSKMTDPGKDIALSLTYSDLGSDLLHKALATD